MFDYYEDHCYYIAQIKDWPKPVPPVGYPADVRHPDQGHNWVILRGVRLYICDRKVEIILGLSPSVSVKCVLPLFRNISLAKV